MKLLIVEDERKLSDSIVRYLSPENYLSEQAFTFSEAMEKVGIYQYDCILLDLMLPDGNGLDILRKIKKAQPETGVIIVSARGDLSDKVEGLRIGADDYLAKPFHLPELSMRIFALMRRRNFTSDNALTTGGCTIDLLSRRVSVGDKALQLTHSEYDVLLFLIENRHRIVSKNAIAEHLCGDSADQLDDFNFIYAHIKNLKAKLQAAGSQGTIHTFYGTGYQWTE